MAETIMEEVVPGVSETSGASADAAGAGTLAMLRGQLADGDAACAAAIPALRHLLTPGITPLLGEAIVASVRGQCDDLARQLARVLADDGDEHGAAEADTLIPPLATRLAGQDALITHLHALALEARLAARLNDTLALDAVLSPRLRTLITDPDPAIADTAMRMLAAQARFIENQRRLRLPLSELPADLLDGALAALREVAVMHSTAPRLRHAEAAIREAYSEANTRLSLAARLVLTETDDAMLTLPQADLALFTIALARASGQPRDGLLIAMATGQGARVALTLVAARLERPAITTTLLALDPAMASAAAEVAAIDRAQALALLAGDAVAGGA